MTEAEKILESHVDRFLALLLPNEREELKSRIEEFRKIAKEDERKLWICILSLGLNVAAYNSRRLSFLQDDLADIFLKAIKGNRI